MELFHVYCGAEIGCRWYGNCLCNRVFPYPTIAYAFVHDIERDCAEPLIVLADVRRKNFILKNVIKKLTVLIVNHYRLNGVSYALRREYWRTPLDKCKQTLLTWPTLLSSWLDFNQSHFWSFELLPFWGRTERNSMHAHAFWPRRNFI